MHQVGLKTKDIIIINIVEDWFLFSDLIIPPFSSPITHHHYCQCRVVWLNCRLCALALPLPLRLPDSSSSTLSPFATSSPSSSSHHRAFSLLPSFFGPLAFFLSLYASFISSNILFYMLPSRARSPAS
ncbi:hypothetical protein BDW75DRAFT_191300 [Aspergillus navahoensis]